MVWGRRRWEAMRLPPRLRPGRGSGLSSRQDPVETYGGRVLGTPGAIAILLLIGGVLMDLYGPYAYLGLPLLAAAPLAAGAMLSFAMSAAFGALACTTSILVDLHLGRPVSGLLVDLADVAMTSALAMGINILIGRQQYRLAQARGVAEAAQRAVLPDPPARVGPVAVAARYEAAQSEARIGGDLFAVQMTPFGVRAVIGDVRGKGLQAITSVSVAIGAFRQEAEQAPTLPLLARQLDLALSRESERVGDAEEFTTAILVEISADGGTARLVNRGHPSPYLVRTNEAVLLEPAVPELPLGMGLPVVEGVEPPPADAVALPPGASLLLFTDGVTEARDASEVFFDPAPGLSRGRYSDPAALVDTLVADVKAWTGYQPQDDMAIMALTREAEAA